MNDILSKLRGIVGDKNVITDDAALKPFITEYSGRLKGKGLCAVTPTSTQQVSDIVKLCAAEKIPLVPQGGNTGLVGGSVPYDDRAIVLNLNKMNAIRSFDADNFSMTVDGGCVLETVQEAARQHGLFFPLLLGSGGSSQIGGNIATNAGGILTIRYGNTRDLVLGLEVVLPNGDIWDGLRSLRKDNTGYNLKHLFIGSEGTLGVITGAVLKLFPDPGVRETFFASTDDLENVVTLLGDLRATFGENILAYELLSKVSVEFGVAYNPQAREPMALNAQWYILCEITGGKKNDGLRMQVEDALADALQKGLITDAIVSQSEAQTKQFWTLRESLGGSAQAQPGGCIKHDIAVSIASIPAFVQEVNALCSTLIPGSTPSIFGHAADGNLHYDLAHTDPAMKATMTAKWEEVLHAVHDVVQKYDGSFSAEHGIGAYKVNELARRKTSVEMDLMRKIKKTIDPDNVMNPGAVLKE